jgi:hypothetical protein
VNKGGLYLAKAVTRSCFSRICTPRRHSSRCCLYLSGYLLVGVLTGICAFTALSV